MDHVSSLTLSFPLQLLTPQGALGATFTFSNICDSKISLGFWPMPAALSLEAPDSSLWKAQPAPSNLPRAGRGGSGLQPTAHSTAQALGPAAPTTAGRVSSIATVSAPPTATLVEFTLGTSVQDF
ncbi:unnamed protein product [Linum tenue]|uniref:Uncharacterized protein n=1 Tax=Linum tenue TaxID=586396 RepID=A0AAV0KV16_9ROSI|nr:unnamed protein product [Linum tenue]